MHRELHRLTTTTTGSIMLILFSLFAIGLAPASARDLYVDPANGDDVSGTGAKGNPWRTITFALSQTPSGNSTILLAPGIYGQGSGEVFPLDMQPGVSLLGSGFESTRIVGENIVDGAFCPTTSVTLDTTTQEAYFFSSLKIPAGVIVRARGDRPLELYVAGDVLIEGVLRLDGDPGEDGETDRARPSVGGTPGAGGGKGGDSKSGIRGASPVPNGGGEGGASGQFAPGGGGGAGHSRSGQSGRPVNVASGRGGVSYGSVEVDPLFAGSGGGGAGHYRNVGVEHSGGGGGGGGGAILIEASGTVTITGRIEANGGQGGRGGTPGSSGGAGGGGGGGGSGGAIKIRSRQMVLDGATLETRGGQGGITGGLGASPGSGGSDGRIRLEIPGGAVDLTGTTITPNPSLGSTEIASSPDLLRFLAGPDFGPGTRVVGVSLSRGRTGIALQATGGSSCRPRIRGCAVHECTTGILVESSDSGIAGPLLVSSYLYDNGIGLETRSNDSFVTAAITNLTATDNGIGYRQGSGAPGENLSILENSILWGNGDDLEGVTAAQVLRCDVQDGDFNGTNGNLSVDPLFVDRAARNLRLTSSSPLRDLGNPNALGLDGHDPDFETRTFDALADGQRLPDFGADEQGAPELLARAGSVDAAAGLVRDVLFVNGSPGSPQTRTLSLSPTEPVTIAISTSPSGPSPAPFVLFATVLPPEDQLLSPLPLFLGTMSFEIPLVGPANGTRTIVNTIPHPQAHPLLGRPLLQSPDAPTALHLDQGIGFLTDLTLQALILDLGSENGDAATTNTVVLRIE